MLLRQINDYKRLLLDLLPPGLIFNEDGENLNALLTIIGEELLRIDNKIDELIYEANPLNAAQTIDARYLEAGLPDNCTNVAATELLQKREEILGKWRATGGVTKQYLLDVLAAYGFDNVTINELYLDPNNISFYADSYSDARVITNEYANTFQVTYSGVRDIYLQPGRSTLGSRFKISSSNSQLECVVNKIKPAHTTAVFTAV